jgi:hypothetical protein
MKLSGRATLGIAAVAIGCGNSPETDGERRTASPPPSPASADCPVTLPNGSSPHGERSAQQHGNGRLWTSLGRRGIVLVAPRSSPEYYRPDGGLAVEGELAPDGSVSIMKAFWWRGPGVRGPVRIQARRLDASAPRIDRTVPPHGYGLTGLQVMGMTFPTMGCWEVTGSVGEESLTYVTLIRRPA